MSSKLSRLALMAAAGVACLFINDNWSSTEQSTLTSAANARIGRPLTPLSVAGVNRRVERRAYRRGYYGDRYYGGGYYGGNYGTGAAIATAGAVAAGAAATGAYVAAPASGPYAASTPADAPSYVSEAVPVQPGMSATVTDPATGRQCTIAPDGRHWCWTP
jgi:hypothetical protein